MSTRAMRAVAAVLLAFGEEAVLFNGAYSVDQFSQVLKLALACGFAIVLLLLWLVVISAVVSAAHYFMVFWSQVDGRIKQRQRNMTILEQEKKTEDVAARS